MVGEPDVPLPMGASKPVNRYTSSEFHDFVRAELPREFVIQDVDSWALPIANGSSMPSVLVEVKRSHIPVDDWRPFDADRPNLASMLALANAVPIPFWVLYYLKGEPLTLDSRIALFQMSEAIPAYHGKRRVMSMRTWRLEYLLPTMRGNNA